MDTETLEISTSFTGETLALRDFLSRHVDGLSCERGSLRLECRWADDASWFLLRRPSKGGLALRAAPAKGKLEVEVSRVEQGFGARIRNAEGVYETLIRFVEDDLLRLTTTLTPSWDLLVPFWPRDLYPLDENLDPTQAKGWVEAAQRGLNTGLCFFCVSEPPFGAVLYMQNLTALNEYFEASGGKPDGVVGGRWPELGYQPPTAPLGNSPPDRPLRAGVGVTISDAFIALDENLLGAEHDSARVFLERLGAVYRRLDRPEPEKRDWAGRAVKTLDSLRARNVHLDFEGALFIRPYVDAEYPDCMVQSTVAAALAEYESVLGLPNTRSAELVAGLDKFYDASLRTLRRYLPSVGADKNRTEVDAWYLYHPLMNLARLAGRGHDKAKTVFRQSIGYAVSVAQHFEYKFPITFDVVDLRVTKASRDETGLGQTDVAGMYAYVALMAHDMTGDDRYVEEAKRAIRAAAGLRFELTYQTNLTAWGALACLRLAKLGDQDFFKAQALVYLASFFHNCEIWRSKIAFAKHYNNFLSATCLHDGPYMAAFECFDSFAAFEEALREHGDLLPVHVRALLADYCSYALDRAWYYYPEELPHGILSSKVRSGRIDCSLSLPLEDLYPDGQPAGQVGQEVYGCGGAFTFAARQSWFEATKASELQKAASAWLSAG